MPRKPKFRPEITRVKLNPEQAVLTCNCYDAGFKWTTISQWWDGSNGNYICSQGWRVTNYGITECVATQTLPIESLNTQGTIPSS